MKTLRTPRSSSSGDPARRYGLRRYRKSTYPDLYKHIDHPDFTDNEGDSERLNPSDEEAADEMASSSDEKAAILMGGYDEEEEAAVSMRSYNKEEDDSIVIPNHKSLETGKTPPSLEEAEDGGSDEESPKDWDMDSGATEDEDSDVTGSGGGE